MNDQCSNDLRCIALATCRRNDGVPDCDDATGWGTEIASGSDKGVTSPLRVAREGVPAVTADMRRIVRPKLRVEVLERVAVVFARRPTFRNAYAKKRAECVRTLKLSLRVCERGGDEVEPIRSKKKIRHWN